ncbi:hypothetical protein INR49_016963 [Caranx melampygus]|nr:hypothetical protein INR49_016963 [Caranx melampygus]
MWCKPEPSFSPLGKGGPGRLEDQEAEVDAFLPPLPPPGCLLERKRPQEKQRNKSRSIKIRNERAEWLAVSVEHHRYLPQEGTRGLNMQNLNARSNTGLGLGADEWSRDDMANVRGDGRASSQADVETKSTCDAVTHDRRVFTAQPPWNCTNFQSRDGNWLLLDSRHVAGSQMYREGEHCLTLQQSECHVTREFLRRANGPINLPEPLSQFVSVELGILLTFAKLSLSGLQTLCVIKGNKCYKLLSSPGLIAE